MHIYIITFQGKIRKFWTRKSDKISKIPVFGAIETVEQDGYDARVITLLGLEGVPKMEGITLLLAMPIS